MKGERKLKACIIPVHDSQWLFRFECSTLILSVAVKSSLFSILTGRKIYFYHMASQIDSMCSVRIENRIGLGLKKEIKVVRTEIECES